MQKDLLKYINGEKNVVLVGDNLLLSRSKLGNGYEHIEVQIKFDDDRNWVPMYEFWNKQETKDPKPKDEKQNTGGKKPYVMVMIEEVEKLRKTGVKNIEELIGYIVVLSKNVEWNTGKVINVRTKEALTYNGLLELYGCSNNKLNKMIKLMREHDLIYNTSEGYFISPKLIKKGKMPKVQEEVNDDGRGELGR